MEQNVHVPRQLFWEVALQQPPLSSHRDGMKNQHTVKNGLSSFSQEGSLHPFSHSIPSRVTCMQAKVKGILKLNETVLHSPYLSFPFLSCWAPFTANFSIMLLQALAPAHVYLCTPGDKNCKAQSWGACFCASHTLLTHFDNANKKNQKQSNFCVRLHC